MSTLTQHILQSTDWGDFRRNIGTTVVEDIPNFQMTIHKLPKLPYTIGYIPKSNMPTKDVINRLTNIGKKHNCIFIKFEPNTIVDETSNSSLIALNLNKSSHPLFTKYTFHIDLTKSENELIKNMKPKTRYNIKIAKKHNVIIKDETDNKEAFEHYINLSKETWKRQHFRGHTENYHRLMWQVLKPKGIAHLLIAYYTPDSPSYQPQTPNPKPIPLTAWILFLHKNVLYYPYGASSVKHKKVMANNLMMWEAMLWGKKHGATLFDLWGALGPNPDKSHPWYGFHRFKEGYGGELVEFVGSYDLVLNPLLYKIYNVAHPIRQKLMRL